MSAPAIELYNESHAELVATWPIGTVKAQVPSDILTVHIWNNRNGFVDVSDLKDCVVGVYDANGSTANEDVAKDKWVQINVPSVDGTDTTWTRIGGEDTKQIRANADVTDFSISGAQNDGAIGTNGKNFSTIRLRVNAPINSIPGNKSFKVRLIGYYT